MHTKNILITENSNFCRVFEMPVEYPSTFCFNVEQAVEVKMVDWFNPIASEYFQRVGDEARLRKAWHDEIAPKLVLFVRQKQYVQKGHIYILLTDFGEVFTFTG